MANRAAEREEMIRGQLARRGIRDERLLNAFRRVPRERFVPSTHQASAYVDGPLSIGDRQTISQPYIVALMTQLLDLTGRERVLEIGTGSGYQTAILAELAREVFTVEIIETLAKRARNLLGELGYGNARFHIGDGSDGWPEHAPFDRIMVTAAPREMPRTLLEQLAVGGIAAVPVGELRQELIRITRTEDGFQERRHGGVRFVPMTGKALGRR